MEGANEYARLFKTGQYGRLYIVSGGHARGRTFKIYVLPEGEVAKGNGESNAPSNDNAVEVYGILGGHPGWTEYYGWIHKGKWCNDFYALVEEKKREKEEAESTKIEQTEAAQKEKERFEQKLLDLYR